MVFNRIKTYFQQFRILKATRLLSVDAVRKWLDPCATFSYSQTGEDRIIDAIIGRVSEGYYVDVGCHHPQILSNTFAFYKKGWKGINIDANEKLIQEYQNWRPRDISLCAVISNKKQEVVFTEFDDPAVSSLSMEHIDEWSNHRKIINKRNVTTSTLQDILEEHMAPGNFDLLSIDVEGHDYEVLSSLNLNIYRPKLIVIEMHKFNIVNPGSSEIYEYLKVHNYNMIGYVIMNGYFLDALIKA
ncbi:hypothetical protein WA1_12045 [Scytonema hofmannii PCC 7110]|uniref:Methyltransferase FkbM domain-containing protein n=1 Tax=Scytonema hofmannii PCC 7110 TaxID=128403 RepID=A0A139XDS3_9CYAN|nr:FkbM family methyltransferase [Scytonema hofmannii]KYC42849.1 hypothetical protein WA1_12045 [Scytonema hofmannii PCC 7110]